eukprot:XP_014789738.1 PREDICTED: peritrophin-1-like [Octopus bimaculoides]
MSVELKWILVSIFFIVTPVISERCYRHGAYKRDPRNCHKFYRCNWGYVQHLTCPKGTAFNPRYMVCDYIWRVPECQSQCPPSSRDPNEPCPRTPPILPKDSSCREPTHNTLISARSFSESRPDRRCHSSFAVLPNPRNNSSYFVCLENKMLLKSCPPGLTFDRFKNRCDWSFLSL